MSAKTQVILQARTGSKRLYGKSVIPIIDEPLVVLCNKRLKYKNFQVTTVIPKGKEDDYLAHVLKKNRLNFVRGDKFDVLKRFKDFTKNFKKNDIIVRVTADNPFVDKNFLIKLIKIYKLKNLEYFSAHDNVKNLPYGIQAEIFRVKHLREIKTNKKFVKEHVTPTIRKKYLKKDLNIYLKNYSNLPNLYLSIDTFDDLTRVKNIFLNYSGSPYSNLFKIIKNKKKDKKRKKKDYLSKIILGTVQIGKKYFQNKIKISQARANNILNTALKNNINFFDTAHDYGNSEKYIGNFKIKNKKEIFLCSKLKNLNLNKNIKKEDIIKKMNFSIFESLNRLKSSQIENFLVHNSQDLYKSKFVYDHLKKFFNCNIIKNIGVSIYNPKELKKIKNFHSVNSVQLPFNLIDHRWVKTLNKKKKINIFVRSIFLRGNLKKNKITFPNSIRKTNKINEKLRSFCKKFGKKNLFELTLAYLKSFQGIDHLVIGAQNSDHIKDFKKMIKTQKLNKKQKNMLIKFIKTNFDAKQADLRNWH